MTSLTSGTTRTFPVIGERVSQMVKSGLLQQKASLHRNASEVKVSNCDY